MTSSQGAPNSVKQRRQALGMSQERLAQLAGISRTGLSAIEAGSLTPSVSTAIALARGVETSVEELFSPSSAPRQRIWAVDAASFPARYWSAEVAGNEVLFPVESALAFPIRQDGILKSRDLKRDRTLASKGLLASRTLVIATCDPAIGFLAQEYAKQSPFRLLALQRSSREAMAMLSAGHVHAAGVHFAPADEAGGNAAVLNQMGLHCDVEVLSIASWEEGIAHSPSVKVRSSSLTAKSKLRWIGRPEGAGARRIQDEVLHGRSAPRHVAARHSDVVSSIRSGLVDVGVCVRLAAEEGNVAFMPLGRDDYDLCFPSAFAADPRLTALVEVVRSSAYRDALAELPGYHVKRAGSTVSLEGRSIKAKEAPHAK